MYLPSNSFPILETLIPRGRKKVKTQCFDPLISKQNSLKIHNEILRTSDVRNHCRIESHVHQISQII